MRRHRIVNLSDLLFCLAPKWEAANLQEVENKLQRQYGNNMSGG